MIRRPPRSTLSSSSAASDVYKRQGPLGGVAQFSDDLAEQACLDVRRVQPTVAGPGREVDDDVGANGDAAVQRGLDQLCERLARFAAGGRGAEQGLDRRPLS